MRIKFKYIVYAVVAIIAVSLIFNFFIINHAKDSKFLSVGETAPNYAFQLANGSVTSIKNYSGKSIIVWFVATWCSSCAQGNQAVASNLNFFKDKGVKIIELEQYDDLGQSGMPISQFIKEYGNNNTYVEGGIASYNMTLAYNTPPTLQLDIYYLIGPSGKILYKGEGIAEGITALENTINKYGL